MRTQFQVAINERGHYTVEAYFPDHHGNWRWQPMRSFGDHQGDAKDFCEKDCPRFSLTDIRGYITTYFEVITYKRGGFKRYLKEIN